MSSLPIYVLNVGGSSYREALELLDLSRKGFRLLESAGSKLCACRAGTVACHQRQEEDAGRQEHVTNGGATSTTKNEGKAADSCVWVTKQRDVSWSPLLTLPLSLPLLDVFSTFFTS